MRLTDYVCKVYDGFNEFERQLDESDHDAFDTAYEELYSYANHIEAVLHNAIGEIEVYMHEADYDDEDFIDALFELGMTCEEVKEEVKNLWEAGLIDRFINDTVEAVHLRRKIDESCNGI